MRLYKPDWVHHEGFQILSIHIDSFSKRIATGGRGASTGKICIWDADTLLSFKSLQCAFQTTAEEDEVIAKSKLSELDEHAGCVNSVRWSKDGKLLASGGDDGNVIIWSMQKMTSFVDSAYIYKKESWKVRHTLQEHKGDVLDIAWSYCGKFLASASVDNLIIIWNTQNFPCIYNKLVGHESFVKGLSWDPVGEYLASQSEDKTVKIWPTLKFSNVNTKIEPVTTIYKPFKKSSASTQFLRLDWSPDGNYLITAHACNNSIPVAKIVCRKTWECKKDFVGHKSAICCVAFNKNIYSDALQSKKINIMCALGSRDGSISIWKLPFNRPVIVFHSIFDGSITDMVWDSLGENLLISSSNGSICHLFFDPNEFGSYKYIDKQIEELHKSIHGLSLSDAHYIPIIPNSFEFLNVSNEITNELIEEESKKTQSQETDINSDFTHVNYDSDNIKSTNASHAGIDIDSNKQQVTILEDGRKRIKPVLIAAPVENTPVKRKKISFLQDDGISFKKNRKSSHQQIQPNNLLVVSNNEFLNDFLNKPKIEKTFSLKIHCKKKASLDLIINNQSIVKESKVFQIECRENEEIKWKCNFLSKILLVTFNKIYIAVLTKNNYIQIYQHDGFCILPAICLPEPCVYLKLSSNDKNLLIIVSSFGRIYSWGVNPFESLQYAINIPLGFGKKKALLFVEVIRKIYINIYFSDHSSYIYNAELKIWIPIFDRLSFYQTISNLKKLPDNNFIEGHFNNLQEYYDIKRGENIIRDENSEDYISLSISQYINKLNIFFLLKIKDEYLNVYKMFINYLLIKKQQKYLKLILDEYYIISKCKKYDKYAKELDISSETLLKTTLEMMSKHVYFQDLYNYITTLLKE